MLLPEEVPLIRAIWIEPFTRIPEAASVSARAVRVHGDAAAGAVKLLGDGARRGDAKPWHFQKADRGARQGTLDRWGAHKEFKASKVVDRLASERSRAPFMADPKKA